MRDVPGVLGQIVEKTFSRVAEAKRRTSHEELTESAQKARKPYDFAERLRTKTPSVIAEIKFASPSEGELTSKKDPVEIAHAYLGAGATALSVLTEPYYFRGDLK